LLGLGRGLADCRDNHCKHGEWLPWLDREFGWTVQTAHNFINVYAAAGKFPNFGDLNVPVSSLYLLAAPSTPEAARDAVLGLGKRQPSVDNALRFSFSAHFESAACCFASI
jgi:hypothetical protein